MALKKEPICRVLVLGVGENEKKQIWSGTVYKDVVFKDADKVVRNIQRALE